MTDIQTAIEEAARDDSLRIFYSKHADLCLTRRPQIDQPLPTGGFHTAQESVRYRFKNGVLRVRVGDDKLVDHRGWLKRNAEQGVERDAVEALKAHHDYGHRFHLEGEEPGRPQPLERDFLKALTKAATKLDVAQIESMLEQEKATHKRMDLVLAAESALEGAREELESLAKAQAEAERAQGAKKS